MLSEYKVNLVSEVVTEVTVVAESEEAAFDSIYEKLLDHFEKESMIASVEVLDYTVSKQENKIH